MNLYTQSITAMLMVTSGLALGFVFDSYCIVAIQFKFSRLTLSFLDLIYWPCAMWFVFQMLVKGNQGELRFYVPLSLAAGACLYGVFLRKIMVTIINGIVIRLKAVWCFFVRCVYVLIWLPLKSLWTGTKVFTLFLLSSARFFLKIVIQCLRPLLLFIFWLFRPLIMPLWNRFAMTERCELIWKILTLVGKRITTCSVAFFCAVRRFLNLFRRNG